MGHKYNRSSKDANHSIIVKGLRKAGALVLDITAVKDAFDILVGYKGKLYIMEIKNPDYLPSEYDRQRLEKALSAGEVRCMQEFDRVNVPYHIVTTIDEALKIIGAIE